MINIVTSKRPASLVIISCLCFAAIAITVIMFIRMYNYNPYAGPQEKNWYIAMIALQLPIIAGVMLMYQLKKVGLWLFLSGKVILFALPAIAGVDVMGLLTPIFMIESATFLVLFGRLVRYMK